jgi:hypothetical protein
MCSRTGGPTGLYKQVNSLKGEVSSLKFRLKIQTYMLIFLLVICLLLICHRGHQGMRMLYLGH